MPKTAIVEVKKAEAAANQKVEDARKNALELIEKTEEKIKKDRAHAIITAKQQSESKLADAKGAAEEKARSITRKAERRLRKEELAARKNLPAAKKLGIKIILGE